MNFEEESQPLFSVVVPVYNEASTLDYSLHSICGTLAELDTITEVIAVNDGSIDASQSILEGLCDSIKYPNVRLRIVELSRNFGHSSAVLAGLFETQGNYIGIIDADLQDPPAVLVSMFEKLRAGEADVVYGLREKREAETVFKKTTAWIFYRVLRFAIGFDLPADTGDFRVMTKQVRDAVLECREQEPFLRGLVSWVGFRQIPFSYVRVGRKFGQTQYTLRKMTKFGALAIVSFSTAPLLLAVYAGLTGILLSCCLTVWILYSWFKGSTIPGWASVAMILAAFQSLMLFVTGIQGVYVGRTLIESKNRPKYFVRSRK